MKKLQFIFFILFLASFLGCTKVFDEVTVEMHLDQYFGAKGKYPKDIPYTAHGDKIDSICLIVDGVIHNTQYQPEKSIVLMGEPNTRPVLAIAVYHHSGLITYSERVQISVSSYYKPDVSIDITNINNDDEYFIGEQLLFKFSSHTYGFDINDCQQMNLKINGQDLGTLTARPFRFQSHVITTKVNKIELEIKDVLGVIHNYEETIEVPINPPTELEFRLSSNNGATSLSFNDAPVRLHVDAHENTKIDHIDYYLDQELAQVVNVNSSYYYNDSNIDTLSVGRHELYCIITDDRGNTVQSETFLINMNKVINIDFDDKFIDTKTTNSESIIYALSKSKLFIINPVLEEISNTLILPYPNAISFDYVEEQQMLFIAFESGQIVVWDETLSSFTDVCTSIFSNIRDIEIDYVHQKAFLISNAKLYSYDLTSGDTVCSTIPLEENSCLAFNKMDDNIIVGGNTLSTGNKFYKMKFESGSFIRMTQKRFGRFVDEIYINPNSNELIFRSGRNSGTVWDIDDFGNDNVYFEITYPSSVAYNYDYSEIVLGEDTDNKLHFFDARTYQELYEFKLPYITYESTTFLIPAHDPKKWVIFINIGMHSEAKIAFLNL